MKPRDSLNFCAVRSGHLRTFVLALILVIGTAASATAGVVVSAVRIWTAPDHTRVVFDLSGPTAYDARRVGDPERIAVNIVDAVFAETGSLDVDDPALEKVRRNAGEGRAQAVLDLKGDVRWRHFALKAADGRPDRIVIDVYRPDAGTAARVGDSRPSSGPKVEDDDVVVVIDPGHGGLDPGAIRDGIREKDVVLGIALELKRIVEEREGHRVVLTRDGDYFVRLADRVSTAQEAGGDLFLSIHANTHDRSALSGMEVYFLSRGRAEDREAQELADRENAADLVGLAPEEHDDDDVLEILMDLRSSRVLTSSNRLADQILAAARRSGDLDARSVKQEVFRVLQSLAMPSSLIETAYLSNDADRALLTTKAGRRKIAGAIADGLFAYLGETRTVAAMDPDAWSTVYRVRSGDTLWTLARRHRTTVVEIRRHNDLRENMLAVGQQLTLP
jgi:N-acetylmuramoyl-L-alanine amidase